jgi:hypothetical protein
MPGVVTSQLFRQKARACASVTDNQNLSMRISAISAALIAGLVSGIAGLLIFLTIHHLWIRPIWDILPPGLFIAALGGLAVGWAYAEIQTALPPRPWRALAVFLLVGATLTPAILLAQMRPPLFDINTGAVREGTTIGEALARAGIELLLTATLAGGLGGWLLSHNWRAALAMALAGFIFALGPGHNIPFLGGTPVVGKGIMLLVAIIATSALVLVESEAWLSRHRWPVDSLENARYTRRL